MTVANVNVTKVLFKRGNTVQNNAYTGVSGEITIDTQAKTLRIHDGSTVGGNIITATLTGNAGSQQQSIDSLNANVGAYQIYANANASTQAISIDSLNANLGAFQTFSNSNASTQTTSINSINANLGAFQSYANITLSTIANAASQESAINSLNANIGAYQTFANANAASQTTEINSLRANITAANSAITSLTSNAAIQAALLDTLTGNAATQSTVLDTLTANAATQATTLTSLLSNAISQETSLISLLGNAATQGNLLNSKANLSGAVFSGNVTAPYLFSNNNVHVDGYILVGSEHDQGTLFKNPAALFYGNTYNQASDKYFQLNLQNTDPNGSGDIVITADDGTDVSNYITIGVNGSSFSDPSYPEGPGNYPHDGYIYFTGGNLVMATAPTGGSEILITNNKGVYIGTSNGTLDLSSENINIQGNLLSQANNVSNLGTDYAYFLNSYIGNVFATSITTGNVLPSANVTYSLGDATHQWKDLWVSNNTIYIGGTPVRVDGETLLINNSPISSASIIGNLQIDNNNNQLSFGPGESYSFLYMKNDGSETRLANDNGNVQISTIKQGPGGGTYFWTFDDTGNILLPNNSSSINYANGVSILSGLGGAVYGNIVVGNSEINFVANSSGDGYGFGTIELRPDTNAIEDSYLIIDPTYPSHIHIRAGGAQDNSLTELYLGGENSHFKVNNGLNPDVSIAANNYVWLFGTDGSLTFPTSGNLIFDSSATSIIDGVTDINAVGTIGANVIQVLSDLTSFGASPAPRIYGFSSIATTGSAVNEGNISASGNLVASLGAYVSGNVFAARYNFANGVNILSTVGAGSYGNTQVAEYLPAYTGNVGAARVQVTNAVDFMYGGYPYMGWQLSGSDTLKLRTNIASGDYTDDAIIVDRQSLAVNVVATLTAGNIVTTNGLFWSNGVAYSSGGAASTGNITFSDTTISTAGGAGQGIILNSAGSGEIAMLDYVGLNNTNPGYWLHIGDGAPGAVNNTGNISIDYNNGLDSSRASTIIGYAWWDAGGNGNNNRGIGAHRQFGIYKNDDLYTTKYLEIDLNSGNANLTNIAVSRVTTTNGVFWANGVAFSTGGSTYGNTEVAAYLLTYPNANFATLNTTSANITTVRAANFNTANAVITGGYATGLANISVTGNATVGNLIGTSSNTTIVAGNYSSTFDTVGNVVLPSAFVSGNATVMGIAPGYAPNRPAFRIYGSSSNNWTTSNINFKGSDIVVDYNQGNYFNSTTGVFTAPVAGLYSITLNARIGNNNGQNQIMVLKNGLTSAGNVAVMWECDTNTGTAVHYGVSSVMKLVAGDFLTANITVGNVQFDANDSWTVTYLG